MAATTPCSSTTPIFGTHIPVRRIDDLLNNEPDGISVACGSITNSAIS